MDTDDLSREAYDGIIIEAEYLEKAQKLTGEILNMDDSELDDLFWGNPPRKEELHSTLKRISGNIESIKSAGTCH